MKQITICLLALVPTCVVTNSESYADTDRLEVAARQLDKQAELLLAEGQDKLAELVEGTADFLADVSEDIEKKGHQSKTKWKGMLKKLEEAHQHREELSVELAEVRSEQTEHDRERLAEELEVVREQCERLVDENAHLRGEREDLLERVHELEKQQLELQRERVHGELERAHHQREELAKVLARTQREKFELAQQLQMVRNNKSGSGRDWLVERVERLEREGRGVVERLRHEISEMRQLIELHVDEDDEDDD